MASHFLIPSITSLPIGYDCTIVVPYGAIGERLIADCRIVQKSRVWHEGVALDERAEVIEFRKAEPQGALPPPIVWSASGAALWSDPGFIEVEFIVEDGRALLADKSVVAYYAIYSAPGKKSFFSDNTYKYGSPPIIQQIARYGCFLDTYQAVYLDRARDCGESLVFINPYKKPLLASVKTHDGRSGPRIKVPPHSARSFPLSSLLRADEECWIGRLQISANNRVIVYDIKHALSDPTLIHDHEHMDPFRGESTHISLTLAWRRKLGAWISSGR